MTTVAVGEARTGGMTREERLVVFASSTGTVLEWYDFYIYGTLGVFLAKFFFSNVPANVGFIFALLAFAAGFAVRPFGALIFGRVGDVIGRKNTFLMCMTIMGLSTPRLTPRSRNTAPPAGWAGPAGRRTPRRCGSGSAP